MEDLPVKAKEIQWAPPIRKPKHGRKAKHGQALGGRGGRAYRAR